MTAEDSKQMREIDLFNSKRTCRNPDFHNIPSKGILDWDKMSVFEKTVFLGSVGLLVFGIGMEYGAYKGVHVKQAKEKIREAYKVAGEKTGVSALSGLVKDGNSPNAFSNATAEKPEKASFDYNGVEIRGSPGFRKDMAMLFELMRKFVPYDYEKIVSQKIQVEEISDSYGGKDERMYSVPGKLLVKPGYLNDTLWNGSLRDLIYGAAHEGSHLRDRNNYSDASEYPLPKGRKSWSEVPWEERPWEKNANDAATDAMINLTKNFNSIDEENAAFAKFREAFRFSKSASYS